MRIITGSAKGIQLKTLEGNETRPTLSRVKEAIFSMIQFDLEGKSVLDLFSGSGQMALEALSRGAANAVLVDSSKEAIAVINENIKSTKMGDEATVCRAEYTDFLKREAGRKFDIVFLDPPYEKGFYAPTLNSMMKNNMLKPSSIIVCESGSEDIFGEYKELAQKFSVKKQARYAKAFVTVIIPTEVTN